jgi:hypothetical protein
MIPLAGASHAHAVDYAIVIPMRYAECFAILADGRRVRMHEPRQLVGWSGPAERRSFIFRKGDRGIEIRVDAERRRKVRRAHAFRLSIERPLEFATERLRKLTACDGSLVFIRERGRSAVDLPGERAFSPGAGPGIADRPIAGVPA